MVEIPHHAGARSPEYALLGFLYAHPMHGYTLHRQLVKELGHVWRVSQSQTYAILKRLEAQGDISGVTQQQKKHPPRQLLQITPSGRLRFEEWIQSSTGGSVRAIRLEFITRLYFAKKLFPENIPGMIESELAGIKKAVTHLERDRDAIPIEQPFNRLSVGLRIRQLNSVKNWMVECRKAVEIE